MKRKMVALTAALVMCALSLPTAHAANKDVIRGEGTRGAVVFKFRVSVKQAGRVHGRAYITNPQFGWTIDSKVTCASILGTKGIFGGVAEGFGYFTISVSDGPDGMIVGSGQANCGTAGFGSATGLPITTGDITVIDG